MSGNGLVTEGWNLTSDKTTLFSNFNTTDSMATSESMFDRNQRELDEVFSNSEAVILAIVLGLFSLFGIVANGVTFVVILTTPKLSSSVFNIFLMSLCVSDFLSAANSPFVLYRATWGFYEWSLPHVFCKTAISVDFWTSCVTIQHILIFAVLRFISIKFPHHFSRVKAIHAKIIIVFVWIETFFVACVIYYLWPGVFPPGSRTRDGKLSKACTATPQWLPLLLKYIQIGFPTVLYAPMAAVVVITLMLVGLIIKRKKDRSKVANAVQNGSRKENFALVQLSLIMASFMLGYLPDIGYRITAVLVASAGKSLKPRSEWQFAITTHCLLRLSECLNPMFYNLGSSNLRKATVALVQRGFSYLPFGSHVTPLSSSKSTSAPSRTPQDRQ